MAQVGDLITFKTLGERKFAIVTGHSEHSVLLQSLEPGKDDFITYGFESKHTTNITNQLNESAEIIKKYKHRADEAEEKLDKLKGFIQTELDDYGLDACGDFTSALQMVIDKIENLERGEA